MVFNAEGDHDAAQLAMRHIQKRGLVINIAQTRTGEIPRVPQPAVPVRRSWTAFGLFAVKGLRPTQTRESRR
jgi:hypothetical protein